MIDAKQAVLIAKERAMELLGQGASNLEEVEVEQYRNHEVWSITLSFPRDLSTMSPAAQLGADPVQYKRFLIDADTGELVAMKLRVPSPQ